ncbi:hypothetical protein B0A54_03233 [Friedmanniomyces endolithicus]|uniref:BTB domain-containing protein n=1 Tax=Friedmanniomyces endolithicus TaxID=329885 RepID=A0A4U0V7Y7_9PEZI|nr:hypothetical protein LTS09_009670 [Friedmanniomyces endolithicus]TKA44941.1 hypothetical protein B0A54_03233 [Friedmanniomyces endolithicus]
MSYHDDHDPYDERSTPSYDAMTADDSSPWTFHDARAAATPEVEEQQRPRASRHSSLPRTLFGSGSGSLFGSGPSAMAAESEHMGRPPLLAVTQPSQEQVGGSQLSTLARPSERDRLDPVRSTVDRRMLPQVEKDADDPTTPPASSRAGADRQQSTTLTTLSRLFAVQAATSPSSSRHSSYLSGQLPATYTRQQQINLAADLPNHLYTRGLLQGRHSDITVNAFSQQYRLHRIVLDQAPFFTSALSAPWLEADSREVTVHPDDIDNSITQSSFELALKRLYGASNPQEEDADAVGLFATGCWLEMQDLIDDSIGSMLRQMSPETISPLIRLVTNNYYGRSGDKILASAKAMLCRDGWRMPLKYWDGIPGDIIREIVGGDGFFIDGEWDRWVLAKRIMDRRLRARAMEAGLSDPLNQRKVRKAPDTANLMAVRFDGVYRKNSVGRGVPDALQPWVALYTHPDIEPILVLLDEGIHYMHLDFEQLQFIRRARDCLGLAVMPDKVISSALWQQMELRQKVMNARDPDMELELSARSTEEDVTFGASRDTTMSITTPAKVPVPLSSPNNKGKQRAGHATSAGYNKHMAEDLQDAADSELDSGSWDGNGKPRKFWIPTSDCNIVMGGRDDPVIATSNNAALHRHASRLSATIQPEDIQWASDFTAITSQPRPPSRSGDGPGNSMEPAPEVRFTHFPPFRFAAEFPNPRLLKEKKRVYSRTVFYAGSLWNIYIQKVATTRNKQLGVYLHRAKERETEEVIAGTAGLAQGSVDERIGQLEREMILRSERRERRQRRRTTMGSDGAEGDGAESSGSAGDHETSLLGPIGDSPSLRSSTMRNLLSRSRGQKAGHTDLAGASPTASSSVFATAGEDMLRAGSEDQDSESESSDEDSDTERLISASRKFHVPTLPPYVDARPTIKTYFKIYSPSRGGRMLSVYESAPDKFNFSQSWGWKSSTLMLDDGLMGSDEGEDSASGVLPKDDEPGSAGGEKGSSGRTMKGRGDGKLRFMVVIGNI